MMRLDGVKPQPKGGRRVQPVEIKDTDINKELLRVIVQQRVTFKEVASFLGVHGSTLVDRLRNYPLSDAQREQIVEAIENAVRDVYGYIYRVPEKARMAPEVPQLRQEAIVFPEDTEARIRKVEAVVVAMVDTVYSMLEIMDLAIADISATVSESKGHIARMKEENRLGND